MLVASSFLDNYFTLLLPHPHSLNKHSGNGGEWTENVWLESGVKILDVKSSLKKIAGHSIAQFDLICGSPYFNTAA